MNLPLAPQSWDSLVRMAHTGKSFLVVGFGISGLAAARYLRILGCKVRLCDRGAIPPDQRQELEASGVEVREHDDRDPQLLAGIDMIVPSPSMPLDHPLASLARARSLAFVTDIGLALARHQGDVIAVTGTNGKSTVSAMIYHILQSRHVPSLLAGNIGTSPCDLLARGQRLPKYLVLELSSYQLEWMPNFAPRVGVFLNLAPDHLARHKSMTRYLAAKWQMFVLQGKGDWAIVAPEVLDRVRAEDLPSAGAEHIMIVPEVEGPSTQVYIPHFRAHDRVNARFAVSACHALQLPGSPSPEELWHDLATYRPLPFRCAHSAWINVGARRIEVINDSKSTTLHSTGAALRSFASRKTILMLGGQSKGEPFSVLAQHLGNVEQLIAFGEAGPSIVRELSPTAPCAVRVYPTLASSMQALASDDSLLAEPADLLLFSPGCASFDEFRNFEERGRFFDNALRQFKNSRILDP